MAAMGPDPARGPDLQQLAQLCPQLPMATVESVYVRYCKDGNRALDALLGISSPRQLPRPVAVEQDQPPVDTSPYSKHYHCCAHSDQTEALASMVPSLNLSTHSTATPTEDKPECQSWWPGWPAPGECAHSQDPPDISDPGGGPSEDGWATQGPSDGAWTPQGPSEDGWPSQEEDVDPAIFSGSANQSGPTTPKNTDDAQGLGSLSGSGEVALLLEAPQPEVLPHPTASLYSPTGSQSPPHGLDQLNSAAANKTRPAQLSPAHPRSSSSPAGFTPVELLEAVAFYHDLFHTLEREVVADVLQRYSDTPQTALEQLSMLSICMEDAKAGKANGVQLPEDCSWDDGSSWDGTPSPPASPPALDAALLSDADSLEALQAEFGAVTEDEARGALTACDFNLAAAAKLLRVVHEEALAAAQAAPAPPPPPTFAEKAAQHPAVALLAQRFPSVPTESVEVALQCSEFSIQEAASVLVAQGYTEAAGVREAQAAAQAAALAPKRRVATLAEAKPMPRPVPVPAAGMSVSDLSHLQVQTIYDDTHGTTSLLRKAYTKCFAYASEAFHRGDHAAAARLSASGADYRQRYIEARARATQEMSKKMNEGNAAECKIDLHGRYVDEALEMVETNIRDLPTNFPGGIRMRYITGKGLHSAGGARLKPAVMELLESRGIPFVEEPGSVVATFGPA